MVQVSDMYYIPRSRQENGRGQAKIINKVKVRVADRHEVRASVMVRQAGSESRQARVKTRRTSKNRDKTKQAHRKIR